MASKKKTLVELFALNFAKLRAERKLTQQKLAEEMGMSVSYVSMLERGERTPPLSTLEKIGQALGVDPLELLE
jgi:transcriptional regulator with XRE-family HTH domain